MHIDNVKNAASSRLIELFESKDFDQALDHAIALGFNFIAIWCFIQGGL